MRTSQIISQFVPQLTFFYFVPKISAYSGPERQFPNRSGTNKITGFHVPDRS